MQIVIWKLKNNLKIKVFLTIFFYLTTSLLFAESFKILGSGDQERMQIETTFKEYEDGRLVSGKSTVETAELIYSQSLKVFYELLIDNYEKQIQRIVKKGPKLRVVFLESDSVAGFHRLEERERFVQEKGSYAIFTSDPNFTIIGALIDSIFLHIPSSTSFTVSSANSSDSREVKFLDYHFKQKNKVQSSSTQEYFFKDGKEIITMNDAYKNIIESSAIGLKFSYIERMSESSDSSREINSATVEGNLSIRKEGSEIKFLNELLGKIYISEDLGIRIAHFKDKKSFLVQLSIRKEKVNQIIKSVSN